MNYLKHCYALFQAMENGIEQAKEEEERYVGGQALIEGVMMRGAKRYSMAVRKSDGSIKVIDNRLDSILEKSKVFKWPFVRGVIALVENMVIGTRALMISANEAMPEEESLSAEKLKKKTSDWALYITVFISFVLGFGFFVALPMLIVEIVMGINAGGTIDEVINYNLVSGILRVFLFIGYIYAISFLKDVRRIFQYHGSEHKTVNTYEAKLPLTVENVKKYSTYHPRCGTSFMFFVLMIAIVVFSFVNILFVYLQWVPTGESSIWDKLQRQAILIPSHIAVLPLVASISYEMIRLSFKKQSNWFVRAMAFPGYLMQKLTTREPEADQMEVAIAALESAVEDIKETEGAKKIESAPVVSPVTS